MIKKCHDLSLMLQTEIIVYMKLFNLRAGFCTPIKIYLNFEASLDNFMHKNGYTQQIAS